ncbi:MAG TPA: hypothetical protein VIH76_10840 [Candidatus Acidoferrales bacterium]
MYRRYAFLVALIGLGLVSGCGSYKSSGSGSGSGGSGISATITNPITTVQAGATYTFSATSPSNNGYTAGISWSISPSTGAGTLSTATNSGFSSSVIYTAPTTPPSPNSVTITAMPTDSVVSAATDMFTITANAANMLDGQFAFALSGIDGSSEAVNIAGSVTADGAGNISGGEMDLNRGHAPATVSTALAGTYTVDSNGRGVISLTTPVAGVSAPLALAFTLTADGNSGTIMGSDANGFHISGMLHRQQVGHDGAAFSLAQISSSFAFKLESNSTSRVATVGKLTIGENSNIVGIEDSSESGIGTLLTSAAVAGRITAPPDANGRGALMLSTSAGAMRLAFYVVSEKSLVLIETNSASVGGARQIGSAERQLSAFSPAAVNASSILHAAGFDAQPSTSGPVSITGNISIENLNHATLNWTANTAGEALPEVSLRSELVTFDPTSGRGTIKIANGYANNFADSVVFYLSAPGDGLILDTTEGRFNRAISGDLRSATSVSEPLAISVLRSLLLAGRQLSENTKGRRRPALAFTNL